MLDAINKITIKEGNSSTKRSVKDIKLYFDASKNYNYIIFYCVEQGNYYKSITLFARVQFII
jgi:hypothetical protein